ncbi:MAG: hypothetical protein WBM69_15205 [Desulfobacterales bacterium]
MMEEWNDGYWDNGGLVYWQYSFCQQKLKIDSIPYLPNIPTLQYSIIPFTK